MTRERSSWHSAPYHIYVHAWRAFSCPLAAGLTPNKHTGEQCQLLAARQFAAVKLPSGVLMAPASRHVDSSARLRQMHDACVWSGVRRPGIRTMFHVASQHRLLPAMQRSLWQPMPEATPTVQLLNVTCKTFPFIFDWMTNI